MGYSATSLRAVTQRAGVNLASAHYHFGSKAGLLSATLHRRTVPINAKRIEQLDALLASSAAGGSVPDVESVMRAFFAPLIDPVLTGSLPRIIARIYGEPGGLAASLLEQEFGATASRFVDALKQALPHVEAAELRWRFHFVVGAMVHLLNFDVPLGMPSSEMDPEARAERLLQFAVAGLCQAGSTDAVTRPAGEGG